jgi:hypothetical protein
VSAFVYNDGLGFLAATVALVAAATVARRGPTLPRLAGLAGASAVAALTRAPGLALVAVAAAAAAAGVLLHRREPPARRLPLAAAAGLLVTGLAAGPAIGFYLRNRSLYGSLTGAAYNQELFRFKPQDHVLDLLLSPTYALRLYDGLWAWTRLNLPRVPALPLLVAVPRVIGVLARGRRGRVGAGAGLAHRVFAMVAAYDGNGATSTPATCSPAWPCSRSWSRSASTGSPGPAVACGSPASPSLSWS